MSMPQDLQCTVVCSGLKGYYGCAAKNIMHEPENNTNGD